jgi:hypothetical protein
VAGFRELPEHTNGRSHVTPAKFDAIMPLLCGGVFLLE